MKSRLPIVFALLTAFLSPTAIRAMSPEDRESYKMMLLLNLPNVPSFDRWILQSKELPPDFDAFPRHNGLPDPLTFLNGKAVKTAADWKARREEILQLYQKHVWGTVLPRLKFDHAAVQDSPGQGYRTRTGTLYAGPEGKGTMRITLRIPDGNGPFPVVMGPGLIGGGAPGGPAEIIGAQGYIVASYAANDGSDDSANLAALYPQYDPRDGGVLPRRAWAASVVVDYLETLPEVRSKEITITGFAHDGKAVTIAAALDERIAAVIANSPGIGGTLPFRLAGERNQAESLQSMTLAHPDWFHMRLRYFTGREDRLPVDGNLLLAALAPRPYLLMAGQNDEVSNVWGDEQSVRSAERAYALLNTSGKLGLLRVPGYHGASDWKSALSFLAIQFGRSNMGWGDQSIFPWDFGQWKKTSAETVDLSKHPDRRGADLLSGNAGPITTAAAWESKAAAVRKNIEWMLGDATPAAGYTAKPFVFLGPAPDVAAWVIQRSIGGSLDYGWFAEDDIMAVARAVTFNGVQGTLYTPRAAPPGIRLPTVIWLHSTSYPLGYMWGSRPVIHPVLALVENGYAVLAYDQCGFGSRMNESPAFFERTPHWSQMGRMVADARAAVDALSKENVVDARRIYLFGYGMGGNVALYTGALEPRVAGVVSVCGFTPMRTDTAETGTGGIARYALDRPLIPRLGFFVGSEAKIPYDYDEMLGAIAPRPAYVANPLFDREANFKDVHAGVEAARKVYGLYKAEDQLRLDEPYDSDRLSPFLQDRILLWMRDHMN